VERRKPKNIITNVKQTSNGPVRINRVAVSKKSKNSKCLREKGFNGNLILLPSPDFERRGWAPSLARLSTTRGEKLSTRYREQRKKMKQRKKGGTVRAEVRVGLNSSEKNLLDRKLAVEMH